MWKTKRPWRSRPLKVDALTAPNTEPKTTGLDSVVDEIRGAAATLANSFHDSIKEMLKPWKTLFHPSDKFRRNKIIKKVKKIEKDQTSK